MARPSLPESDKKRTVPFRMTKPDYRALMTAMKLTDTTIQEHLREALRSYLEAELKRLAGQVSFKLPSSYEMGAWSDDQFAAFLASIGRRKPAGEAPSRPRFARRPATAVAA